MRKHAWALISRWTTPAWPAVLLGIVLGAVLGTIGFHGSQDSSATAMIRIYQPVDPNQIMSGTGTAPESQQDYISGEIAYLTSPGFASAVAKQLNQTTNPTVSASQNVESSIVTMSATAPDTGKAVRTVDAAIKVYGDHVLQQSRERGQAAINAIDSVLQPLEQDVTADPSSGNNSGSTSNSRSAGTSANNPQDRIDQLKLQRLAIEVQTQRSTGVQMVSPPAIDASKGASDWALGALAGGLVGGALTLAGVLAWRRQVGVITSVSALKGRIEPVLLPVIRLGRLKETSDEYAQLARSLYAQLPVPRTGSILLVGASADSGTEEVAQLIAFAAAEHSRVRVNHLPTGIPFEPIDLPEDLTEEVTWIIDGGSIDTCPLIPEAAEYASQIVIVAMIGRDVNDTVRMARQWARETDVQTSAVATAGASRHRGRRAKPSTRHTRRHPKRSAEAQVDSRQSA